MGSRYGLLLASGARRYCRAAIRAASCSPFLPPFPTLFAPSCPVFLVPHQREWWPYTGHEKQRDWSNGNPSVGLDAIRVMHAGIALGKNIFSRFRHIPEEFLPQFLSAADNSLILLSIQN